MKRGFLVVGLFVLWSFPSLAQEQGGKPSYGHGYLFGAVGGVERSALVHFGGGGEGYLYKGLGLGGEVGYLAPFRGFGYGVGIVSLNGLYDFGRQHRLKLSPFVTGGYSLAFRSGILNAFNLGGGVNYWLGERTALRMEFRGHLPAESPTVHLYTFRIGLNFR